MGPPTLQLSAFSTVDGLPHPLHSASMPTSLRMYLIRKVSRNSSWSSSVPFWDSGSVVSHAPHSAAWLGRSFLNALALPQISLRVSLDTLFYAFRRHAAVDFAAAT